MLGTIGFTLAALMFFLYGYSSLNLAMGSKFNRRHYFTGYILVALACVVWGISIHAGDSLFALVLIGDALLFVATAFLLNSVTPHKFNLVYSLIVGVLLFAALYLRIASTSVEPIVRGGILVFNTPRAFGAALSIILLAIWVKANMNFYNKVVSSRLPNVLRSSYYSLNLLGFVSITAFLLARKNLTIIVAFTLLVTSFAFLTVLNYYVSNFGQGRKTQHAK